VSVSVAAYGLVAVLAFLQMGGVKLVAKFQVSLTLLKVLLILAFMVGALFMAQHALNTGILSPKPGDGSALISHKFAMSLFWVMYSYAGWNGAVYVAGDMDRPQRNLPIALLLGTLGVMFLYVGVNAVFLMGADWESMRNQPDVGMVAAQSIFGMRGGWIMGALIAFGLLSTANAIFWTGAATLRVIGQDMRALWWLNATDRRGEPMGAIWFMTALVLLGLLIGSMETLLNYIQALLQLCSLLVVLAVMWWRFRRPEMPRPFRVPLYPLPPLIFVVVSILILYVMVYDRGDVALWCAGTLAVGAVLYFVSKPAAGAPAVSEAAPTES
jgi:APA family basic amino acid/polyamine antiporter